MAKPKKPASKQGVRAKKKKGVQVKDLRPRGSLAEKIKGGLIPSAGTSFTIKNY